MSWQACLLSNSFTINHGVRQGSVLSPVLFLVVMDDLLKNMEVNGSNFSLAGIPIGGAAHADNVRALSTNNYN